MCHWPTSSNPGTTKLDAFTISTASVAVGELGDKTQIVAMALAAKYNDLLPVVTGTTLGMMIVNVPTVLLAQRTTKWLPVKVVRPVAPSLMLPTKLGGQNPGFALGCETSSVGRRIPCGSYLVV